MYRIASLPAPVTAAKSDWRAADHWIGFTPVGRGPDAAMKCQATVSSQAGNGYVIEYITLRFGEPNDGFHDHPQYVRERDAHAADAGRLVAVHRLLSTALSLQTIIGADEFEELQNMWDENGSRRRWSVAFPIVESYDIIGRPLANAILGAESMQRVFGHPSAVLRPLNDAEREAIGQLELAPRQTRNSWMALQADVLKAERSQIDATIRQAIERDLSSLAVEGFTVEQLAKVRLRAAWLAQQFVMKRQRDGALICDACNFLPLTLIGDLGIKPRSLLDVHHLKPLEEGQRVTTLADFALLCPTCHRFEHAKLRLAQKS